MTNKYILSFLAVLFFGGVFCYFSILIFTSHSKIPLHELGNSPSLIGDSIGGITAPVIGLITSGLMFIAFLVQFNFNQDQTSRMNKQANERVFSYLFEEIKEIERNIRNYKFTNEHNNEISTDLAISDSFSNSVHFRINKKNKNTELLIIQLESLSILLQQIVNLKDIGLEKQIAKDKVASIFIMHFFDLKKNVMKLENKINREISTGIKNLKKEDFNFDKIEKIKTIISKIELLIK